MFIRARYEEEEEEGTRALPAQDRAGRDSALTMTDKRSGYRTF